MANPLYTYTEYMISKHFEDNILNKQALVLFCFLFFCFVLFFVFFFAGGGTVKLFLLFSNNSV